MPVFSEESLKYALDAQLPHAFWLVGSACAYGTGENPSRAKAIRFYERGMALGSKLCKRDLSLLLLSDNDAKKDHHNFMRWLADSVSAGAGNLAALNILIHDPEREYRSLAIRWLQHELVFNADWRAGFSLYLSLLFPSGAVPDDKEFLTSVLLSMIHEKPQARKALALGLLSGALTGQTQYVTAMRLLKMGTTPNEIALAALVAMQNSNSRRLDTKRLVKAERSLFIATQSGSAIGNALLLRLTMQQMENSSDAVCRSFVTRSLVEHLSNYPMHADEESLRIAVRWMGEDRHLRQTAEPRLRKCLMRSSEMGVQAAAVSLARISLLDSDPESAVDRLRNCALRGHKHAMQILASPQFMGGKVLSDTEKRFWSQIMFSQKGFGTQGESAHNDTTGSAGENYDVA